MISSVSLFLVTKYCTCKCGKSKKVVCMYIRSTHSIKAEVISLHNLLCVFLNRLSRLWENWTNMRKSYKVTPDYRHLPPECHIGPFDELPLPLHSYISIRSHVEESLGGTNMYSRSLLSMGYVSCPNCQYERLSRTTLYVTTWQNRKHTSE